MGAVSSRFEDATPLHLSQQHRLAVTKVKITTARGRVLYSILPNTFPATRYTVRRESDDDAVTEYVQDPEPSPSGIPSFLLKLANDEDLRFLFTFQMRQDSSAQPPVDTAIKNLTFVFASTTKDLETLITREFNADPNLHKNPNVDLVGDYSTNGSAIEEFEWMWTWRPPKPAEDKGGGHRTCCSFAEYDQRAHTLKSLVTFSFWVSSTRNPPAIIKHPSPRIELTIPSRTSRIPSTQSIESRLSDSEPDVKEIKEQKEPPSPITAIPEYGLGIEPEMIPETFQVDISTRKSDEDISTVEDGPLFRSTMRQLEGKTSTMKARMKNVIKKAQAAKEAQTLSNAAYHNFLEALRDAASSNANAVKPALDHYFEKIATEILTYEQQNAINLQRLIIDPLSRIYNNDIKQSETKKKVFDEGSREYYSYVSKYLGQRQESMKDKKREEKDVKYQNRRKDFELKRFDYSCFMQDLHGGRKDQEVLSQLTKYADAQARAYLASSKKIEVMIPQLDALAFEVKEADKQYQLLRTKSEERRRALEKGDKRFAEIEENVPFMPPPPTFAESTSIPQDIISNGSTLRPTVSLTDRGRVPSASTTNGSIAGSLPSESGMSPIIRPADDPASPKIKMKGFRDVDLLEIGGTGGPMQIRKEGLLWSMSRPGGHSDPKGLNKAAWHKFWIVLDQGKISEYINWRQNLEQHMDPIDLRMASVREARNAERRFCFEIITPSFTRVYQATGEDDMRSWIQAINNALQSAFEQRKTSVEQPSPVDPKGSGSIARDLFGKSSSFHGHRSTYSTANVAKSGVNRHSTVGDKPLIARSASIEERPTHLLTSIRAADAGNAWCADCGSESRVEWVSINLNIIVCIECSGIHRSLGTHVSKIRSLTLDTNAFTQDTVEMILSLGNRVSNMVFEARLDRSQKPQPNTPREIRQRFIQQKYVDRAFVEPLTASTAQFHSADETLLASIKRNDIQQVLYALALAANPNAQDRSRSTHAVFLALAAADPASPVPSLDSSRTPSTPNLTAGYQERQRKSFPIAELLVQNGAEVPPATASPIPLSRSARSYLEFKTAQRMGKAGAITTQTPQATPPREISMSSMSSFELSPMQRREREKLVKRSSGSNAFPRFAARNGQ